LLPGTTRGVVCEEEEEPPPPPPQLASEIDTVRAQIVGGNPRASAL
jgi:hypothetical protein